MVSCKSLLALVGKLRWIVYFVVGLGIVLLLRDVRHHYLQNVPADTVSFDTTGVLQWQQRSAPAASEDVGITGYGSWGHPKRAPKRILFNRVSKCGTRAMHVILRMLSKSNHFRINVSTIYNRLRLSPREQIAFAKDFNRNPTPLVFSRHIWFINFTRFGLPTPTYINLMRDPFQRLVSSHYYFRDPNSHHKMTDRMRNMTYDECVQSENLTCVSPSFYYNLIPYFCGQDKECRIPGIWSLERAKKNIIRYFAVVGITEHLREFLVLMERVFPSYFKGAIHLWDNNEKKLKARYKGNAKKEPSAKTKALMMPRLKYDYDLYFFAAQRFFEMYRSNINV